jgi:mannose/fructose/sorbose-specific phosphotransferase system IIA component
MIGIVVVSHGKMADGVKDSVELIFGEPEQFATSSLVAGQDFEDFKNDVEAKIKAVDTGQGVLAFVDLFGASPYNAAMKLYPAFKEVESEVRVVTGLNLPMIIETLGMRAVEKSVESLAKQAVTAGRDGIQEPITDLLASMASDTIEADDNY